MSDDETIYVTPGSVRYVRAIGIDIDAMIANARDSALYKVGDMKLVWVNEGDLYHSASEFPTVPTQPTPSHE